MIRYTLRTLSQNAIWEGYIFPPTLCLVLIHFIVPLSAIEIVGLTVVYVWMARSFVALPVDDHHALPFPGHDHTLTRGPRYGTPDYYLTLAMLLVSWLLLIALARILALLAELALAAAVTLAWGLPLARDMGALMAPA